MSSFKNPYKVKIITYEGRIPLEDDINNFLSGLPRLDFIDIKPMPNSGVIVTYQEKVKSI